MSLFFRIFQYLIQKTVRDRHCCILLVVIEYLYGTTSRIDCRRIISVDDCIYQVKFLLPYFTNSQLKGDRVAYPYRLQIVTPDVGQDEIILTGVYDIKQ